MASNMVFGLENKMKALQLAIIQRGRRRQHIPASRGGVNTWLFPTNAVKGYMYSTALRGGTSAGIRKSTHTIQIKMEWMAIR
jgi:hypothetical protein